MRGGEARQGPMWTPSSVQPVGPQRVHDHCQHHPPARTPPLREKETHFGMTLPHELGGWVPRTDRRHQRVPGTTGLD